MGNLITLAPETLAHTLASSPRGLLLLFSATWCGPCRSYKPIVERVVDDTDDAVRLLVVDTDTSADIAAHYGVRSVPTLLCFRDGELVGQQTGAMPESRLRTALGNLGLPA